MAQGGAWSDQGGLHEQLVDRGRSSSTENPDPTKQLLHEARRSEFAHQSRIDEASLQVSALRQRSASLQQQLNASYQRTSFLSLPRVLRCNSHSSDSIKCIPHCFSSLSLSPHSKVAPTTNFVHHSPDDFFFSVIWLDALGISQLESELTSAERECERLKASVKGDWDEVLRIDREIETMPTCIQTLSWQAQHEERCLAHEQKEAENWLHALQDMLEYERNLYQAKYTELYTKYKVCNDSRLLASSAYPCVDKLEQAHPCIYCQLALEMCVFCALRRCKIE